MRSCGGFTVGLLWDYYGVILRRSHSIDLSAGQTHLTAVAQVLVVHGAILRFASGCNEIDYKITAKK